MKLTEAFFTGSMLFATIFSSGSHSQSQQQSVKNIVLVHGAFADGTSWAKVIPILESRGFHVVAVQNPLTSLADDVNATRRIIALQDGPVILVGHSWGGAVITEVGDDPKVAGLVYVAAYVRTPVHQRTRPAPLLAQHRDRALYKSTLIISLLCLRKAFSRALQTVCLWQSGALCLQCKARSMVRCSMKS
jgi:pimeloyl-ACP methyl ester carboxylesterase